MPEIYDGSRAAQGVNLVYSASGKQKKWRTIEEQARVNSYDILWNLYLGRHWTQDGGPWPHPYGPKGIEERIPYQQLNILGKGSRTFADLIYGDGIVVTSEDEQAQTILLGINFREIWSALIAASVYGFCAIEPVFEDGQWQIAVVMPSYLYPEYSQASATKLVKLRKAIPFRGIKVGGKSLDLLYEETHIPGRKETRLYQVSGDEIVTELDLSLYNTFVDSEANLFAEWQHSLKRPLLTLLYNERVNKDIMGDYTLSAQRAQQSLNEQKTQITRILKLHSNPKLLAPRGAFVKDNDTGQWMWSHQDSEVLISDPNDPTQYQYLTWNGEIQAALENRDDLIYSLCTELDLTPQLLGITRLVGGTVAETSAKLEKMLHSTIKRAERKREWLWIALDACIRNILTLAGLSEAKFTIKFPDLFPRGRDERLEEAGIRKREGLISTEEALMLIENLEKEEAKKKAEKILIEQTRGENPFQSPTLHIPEETEPEEDLDVAI